MLTNGSFSSQTWAISVPNRNSVVKSIVWSTGPHQVRSQNKEYRQYLIKVKEKINFFAKFVINHLTFWVKIVYKELLCYKIFQHCPNFAFKHIWKLRN